MDKNCYPIESGRCSPGFDTWVMNSQTYLVWVYYDFMNMPLSMMNWLLNVTDGVWKHHTMVVFMN